MYIHVCVLCHADFLMLRTAWSPKATATSRNPLQRSKGRKISCLPAQYLFNSAPTNFGTFVLLKINKNVAKKKKVPFSLPSFFPFSHLSETFQTFTFYLHLSLCSLSSRFTSLFKATLIILSPLPLFLCESTPYYSP